MRDLPDNKGSYLMNRLLRPTLVAALASGLAVAGLGSTASANVEIGGTAGIHVFSATNELGVNDVKDAASERNSALFGLRLGVFFGDVIGVEGELGLVPSEARSQVFDIWNITYRGHLVAQFRAADPTTKLVPFILFGGGAFQVIDSKMPDTIAKDTDSLLYAGIGAKYRVDNGWGLRADARILFPPSSKDNGFTEDFEVLLSIYKEFGRKTVEKVIEAPPPDVDPDKDGIIGDADKCPQEAEDKDGFQDDDGCPELDNDGDGVADAADKCPNEAEDKDGFQDDDGCPDPDNDGDGVPDAQDKCPTDPETKNGYQDDDGCPDELPVKVKAYTGIIQGINFKTNAADLQTTSNKTLDKAVAVLNEYKDLKLEIQGHTDDQPLKKGNKFTDNDQLSQARSEAVKAYFVKKGIDESRMTAKGYGSTQPVEDPTGLKGGKLNAARAKNRRVEFRLVSSLTTPTPPPTPPAPPTPQTPTP
jgi:OOP family OmpA-OmpF porin